MAEISHIAELGHMIIIVGFILFMILLGKKRKNYDKHYLHNDLRLCLIEVKQHEKKGCI